MREVGFLGLEEGWGWREMLRSDEENKIKVIYVVKISFINLINSVDLDFGIFYLSFFFLFRVLFLNK